MGIARKGQYVGKKNPNYRGGKTFRTCVICGKPFCVYPSKINDRAQYCNLKCSRLARTFPKKDSLPERILHKGLRQSNIAFEKHIPITGQPDIFIKPSTCIFVDGDHWHANPKKYKASDHIIGNKYAKDVWKYDAKVTRALKSKGYSVLRLWECDIKTQLNVCLQKIITKMAA
jgi:DNA mismatch endonuclease (patch repair protein)